MKNIYKQKKILIKDILSHNDSFNVYNLSSFQKYIKKQKLKKRAMYSTCYNGGLYSNKIGWLYPFVGAIFNNDISTCQIITFFKK